MYISCIYIKFKKSNIRRLISFIIAADDYFEVDVHDCKPHEKVYGRVIC